MLILVYLEAWRRILKMTSRAGSRGGGGLMVVGRGGRRSIPTPEAEQNVLEEEIMSEEEAESSQGKKELDPNGLWFNDSAVSRTISDAFKQYFHEPWRSELDHWLTQTRKIIGLIYSRVLIDGDRSLIPRSGEALIIKLGSD